MHSKLTSFRTNFKINGIIKAKEHSRVVRNKIVEIFEANLDYKTTCTVLILS